MGKSGGRRDVFRHCSIEGGLPSPWGFHSAKNQREAYRRLCGEPGVTQSAPIRKPGTSMIGTSG